MSSSVSKEKSQDPSVIKLNKVAKLNANEWYFFSFRDRKYATGFRTNRATTSGYWKATGKDRTVVDSGTEEVVGMRKTLVFYRNRAPTGIKTGWIMHEFRLHTPYMPPKEEWVLCRVFHKSKEENGTNLGSPIMLETSSTHAPSLTHQTIYQQISPLSTANPTHPSHPQWLPNLLHYNSNEENKSDEVNSKVDDGCEYLLMDMVENSLIDHHVHGVASNLEGKRFEIDNSMISYGLY